MLKIAVLVSGNGTNLQALLDAEKNNILRSGKIVQVISDNPNAYALERAKIAGIKFNVAKSEEEILKLLSITNPGIIVLAGFLKILSKDFINRCNAQIINVHPSLIPSFCGKGFYGLKVHEAVLKSGVKFTGATVHIVNEIPDGGKILSQKPVKVYDDDTPETLQLRVMQRAEWIILPRTLEKLCKSKKIFKRDFKYPGRGIIAGTTPEGRKMFAYFIMGRSASSRARIFERSGNDLIIKLTGDKNIDSSLILYSPVKVFEKNIIVTNGDQTDTIYNAMSAGKDFKNALMEREHEPDEPHFTPRISAVITPENYTMNILKKAGKFFYQYDFENGKGHLIHTYNHDVEPDQKLPSFRGRPKIINIPENIGEFANNLWNELDENNKVALYVRYYSSDLKNYEDRLFNKEDEKTL